MDAALIFGRDPRLVNRALLTNLLATTSPARRAAGL